MHRFHPTAVLPLAGFVFRPSVLQAPATMRVQTLLKRHRVALVRPLLSGLELGAVLVYGPLILFLDSRLTVAWPGEYLLGAVTLAFLWLCARTLDARDRGLTWMCVVVATGFEVLGSLVWGAYRYRFGGIPLFVPFGHGLIYVFGARLAATSWVRRREDVFARSVLGLAAVWAIAGVTFLTSRTARHDVHGVFWLPIFAYALLRSPRKAFFAALFIVTTNIELAGTWLRNWVWAPVTPWLQVPSGDPPSAIAGGYAVIDGSVLQLVALISVARAAYSRWLCGRRLQPLCRDRSRIDLTAAA